MATLLRPDGSKMLAEPNSSEHGFTLEEMYALIGNGCDMVQVIYLDDGREMWLDEEGKLRENVAPENPGATLLLELAGGIPGDYVIGNVLICEAGEVK